MRIITQGKINQRSSDFSLTFDKLENFPDFQLVGHFVKL